MKVMERVIEKRIRGGVQLNPFATGDAYMHQLFHCLQ